MGPATWTRQSVQFAGVPHHHHDLGERQEADPASLMDGMQAPWPGGVTLDGPGFPTKRGDLMISGLAICTVIDQHTHLWQLPSFAKGVPHP